MVSGVSIYLVSAFGLRILTNQIFDVLEMTEMKSEVAMALIESINRIATYLLGFTSVCLIVTWISALYLSNRIAGPVYKMEKVIDQHLAGDKDVRIEIRKTDFFSGLVSKINLLLDESSGQPKA